MLRVRAIAAVLCAGSEMAANTISEDARRGEQLFQTKLCVRCHSVNGKGGALAHIRQQAFYGQDTINLGKLTPNLGLRFDR